MKNFIRYDDRKKFEISDKHFVYYLNRHGLVGKSDEELRKDFVSRIRGKNNIQFSSDSRSREYQTISDVCPALLQRDAQGQKMIYDMEIIKPHQKGDFLSRYMKGTRKINPHESLLFMGFDDEDFYKIKEAGVSDTQIYRQAGNTMVVNVMEHIIKEMLK